MKYHAFENIMENGAFALLDRVEVASLCHVCSSDTMKIKDKTKKRKLLKYRMNKEGVNVLNSFLLSSADSLCKQFGHNSGLTQCRS